MEVLSNPITVREKEASPCLRVSIVWPYTGLFSFIICFTINPYLRYGTCPSNGFPYSSPQLSIRLIFSIFILVIL
jgi:hypothetical protein